MSRYLIIVENLRSSSNEILMMSLLRHNIFSYIDSDYALFMANSVLLLMVCGLAIGGGLSAVIWTDLAQTIVMIVGAFVLFITGTYIS